MLAMTRLAVVGHVELVEFVPVDAVPSPGEVVHASGAFTRAAGGGGVVAAALTELGAEVDFFCALGRDDAGSSAVAQLTARGARVHVAWRDAPTRRAVTLLDGNGERTIITLGERLEPHGSDGLEWELLDRADGAYFTAGDSGALTQARRASVLVGSPRGRTGIEASDQILDALVFSASDSDERHWADRLAGRARLHVATEGGAGGRWWGESEGRWDAVPLPGARRDAYGCGDSFAAGFTFGLAAGLSVAQAAALGAESGARCLTRSGAP